MLLMERLAKSADKSSNLILIASIQALLPINGVNNAHKMYELFKKP